MVSAFRVSRRASPLTDLRSLVRDVDLLTAVFAIQSKSGATDTTAAMMLFILAFATVIQMRKPRPIIRM